MSKEIVELMKKMIEDGNLSEEVAIKYCPELENEDKKMKKIISDILLIDSDEIREILEANNILMQDIEVWLEKRSPNTMTKLFTFDDILALQCAMKYAKINDYDLYVALQSLHDRILDVYDDEKHGEHKSVEKRIEDESAWSEEDELNLSEALHHIRMYNLADKADKLDKWLKSIKDRLQSKQMWKPSRKQMKDLAFVTDQNKGNMVGKTMISLYKDLKKLTE